MTWDKMHPFSGIYPVRMVAEAEVGGTGLSQKLWWETGSYVLSEAATTSCLRKRDRRHVTQAQPISAL